MDEGWSVCVWKRERERRRGVDNLVCRIASNNQTSRRARYRRGEGNETRTSAKSSERWTGERDTWKVEVEIEVEVAATQIREREGGKLVCMWTCRWRSDEWIAATDVQELERI